MATFFRAGRWWVNLDQVMLPNSSNSATWSSIR